VDLHVTIEQLNASLERRVREALADIKVLRGLIPICAACKKIRDDRGFWTALEEYITEHSDATLTHGICPDCTRRQFPEVVARRERAQVRTEAEREPSPDRAAEPAQTSIVAVGGAILPGRTVESAPDGGRAARRG
jgi:hypothetical protein